jgi:hypothetical protein
MKMPKVPSSDSPAPAPRAVAAGPAEPPFRRWAADRLPDTADSPFFVTDVSVLKRRSAELLRVLLADKA